MSDKLIDEKLEVVKKLNDDLNAKAQAIADQIKELQRQYQVVREEQVRLQGEYRALTALKAPEAKDETPPKKK